MAEHRATDTHEERRAAYGLETRAKYTQAEVDALGAKGHAFGPDDDGHYSYPIDDLEDLRNAVHAVGRGNADHDAIRKYIIKMAGILSATDEIPDNWGSDGSLKEAAAEPPEHRHDAMSGSHSHSHSTFGSQGGDESHTHDHTHDGDQSHNHHQEASAAAGLPATAIRGDYRGVPEVRVSPRSHFELREVPNGTGGTNLRFTGFASVTGEDNTYEMEDWLGPWTESIGLTAFDKTLGENADVAFLVNHTGMTLARTKPGTLKLSAVKNGNASPVYGVTGLHSEALLDPQNMYVQAARSAVERGDLDEMSFAFRVMRQEWDKDFTRRWINEVSLDKGDVSLVNYGANPHTGGTVALRQKLGPFGLPSRELDRSMLVVLSAMQELRAGKKISAATAEQLQKVIGHHQQGTEILNNLMNDTEPEEPIDGENDDGDGDTGDDPGETSGTLADYTDLEYRVAILRQRGWAA